MIYRPMEESDPLFSEKPNRREQICNKYAALVWRHTDEKVIAEKLKWLYEEEYSNGAKDRDKIITKTKL